MKKLIFIALLGLMSCEKDKHLADTPKPDPYAACECMYITGNDYYYGQSGEKYYLLGYNYCNKSVWIREEVSRKVYFEKAIGDDYCGL